MLLEFMRPWRKCFEIKKKEMKVILLNLKTIKSYKQVGVFTRTLASY